MLRSFKRFLRDERGNVTLESLVVIGGSVWMAGVVVGDISVATMGVTERLESRLEYSSIVNDILDGYGPNSELAGGSDGDSGSDDEVDCDGNPGNDKCVGNAGENPNGGDDWGSGSNGMSDSGSTGSSNSGSSGNSGNSATAETPATAAIPVTTAMAITAMATTLAGTTRATPAIARAARAAAIPATAATAATHRAITSRPRPTRHKTPALPGGRFPFPRARSRCRQPGTFPASAACSRSLLSGVFTTRVRKKEFGRAM